MFVETIFILFKSSYFQPMLNNCINFDFFHQTFRDWSLWKTHQYPRLACLATFFYGLQQTWSNSHLPSETSIGQWYTGMCVSNSSVSMLSISMKASSCVVKKVLKRSQKDAVSGRLPNKLKQHSFCNSARFFLLCTESEFHNPFDLLNPNRDNKSTDGIIRKISCNS